MSLMTNLQPSPSGGVDLLIVAYDTLGNHLWATSAGGGGVDQARGLEFDSQDNLYVLGKTSSSSLEFGNLSYSIEEPSILLAKLAPNNIGLSDLPAASALVEIFPNPNAGAFWIRTEQNLEQLEIYNQLGEKVFEKHFSKPTKQQEIETSLITGVYFVLVKTEEGNYTAQKMIVE